MFHRIINECVTLCSVAQTIEKIVDELKLTNVEPDHPQFPSNIYKVTRAPQGVAESGPQVDPEVMAKQKVKITAEEVHDPADNRDWAISEVEPDSFLCMPGFERSLGEVKRLLQRVTDVKGWGNEMQTLWIAFFNINTHHAALENSTRVFEERRDRYQIEDPEYENWSLLEWNLTLVFCQ